MRQASNCVRGVPLPRPLPVRSSRRGENSILLQTASSEPPGAATTIGLRPQPPPLSRPLPPELQGGEENSISLRQGASHLPPPRSLRGRAGEGGAVGRSAIPADPYDRACPSRAAFRPLRACHR